MPNREERTMPEKEDGICQHPACTCEVPEGENYCSPYCSDAGNIQEISCNCGHAGCSLAEGAEATLTA